MRDQFESMSALVGVLLHGSLWICMNLGPFPFITLAFYTCLYHPDEWHRLVRRA